MMSVLQFIILLLSAASCCAAPKPENGYCKKPNSIKEAQIQGEWNEETYPPGTVANFACLQGYTQDGLIKMACIEGTWWQIAKGQCTAAITCNPPEVSKGSVDAQKAVYREGEEIDVKCDDGFVLQPEPDKRRTCTINGWAPPPNCLSKKCDKPHINNGYLNRYYWFPKYPGTEIEYQCNKNYLTLEKAIGGRMECTNLGWNPEPKCLRQCSYQVAYFQNAELKNLQSSYLEGEKVNFKCKPPFRTPEGQTSGTRTCLPDGEFTTAKCAKIEEQCGPPPTVQFGDIIGIRKNSYKSNEFVEYKCPNYHLLKGNKIVRCLNGVWEEAPICLEPCTTKEKSMEENNIKLKWEDSKRLYSAHGDVIEFMCRSGYESLANTKMRIICEHGKVDYPKCFAIGFCVLQQSKMISNNVHYNASTVVDNGQTIKFQCYDEMTSEAGLEATCTSGIMQYPKCTAAKIGDQCGPSPTVPFGDTTGIRKTSYKSGEFVEYKCPNYYLLKGNKIVRCWNGVWGEAPLCLEPCTAKEASMGDNNIQLKWEDTKKLYLTHGDITEFMCKSGYEAPPNTKMRPTCEHGKLEYPKCFRKGYCVLQQSAMIANNVHYNVSAIVENGQTIRFQCNEEMMPEKGLEATCTSEKIHYPKCTVARSCLTPEILNGFFKTPKNGYESGSYAEFECNKDYVKNIPTSPKCENGQWTDQPICYSPCKVSLEDLTGSNIQLVSSDIDKNYTHGTELEVSCKSGFRRPNQPTFFIECYDGKFKYLRCFSGRTCRMDQDDLDANNLELDEFHDNEVYYDIGEAITFKCKKGFRHSALQPIGGCTTKGLIYPTCIESSV